MNKNAAALLAALVERAESDDTDEEFDADLRKFDNAPDAMKYMRRAAALKRGDTFLFGSPGEEKTTAVFLGFTGESKARGAFFDKENGTIQGVNCTFSGIWFPDEVT